MCCVHVKASKPSPPQSWSDCTIIPLTLSSTPPAMRPLFSQDASCLLPDQQSSAVPAKVGPWVNLSACLPCSLDHLGVDPLAHQQFMESGILTGVRIFQNKCIHLFLYIYIFLFLKGKKVKRTVRVIVLFTALELTPLNWHTCKHTLIYSFLHASAQKH